MLRTTALACAALSAHAYSGVGLRSALPLHPTAAAAARPLPSLASSDHAARAVLTMQAAAAAMPPPSSFEITPPNTNAVSRAITGVLFAVICVTVVTAVYPLVLAGALYGKLFDNKRRRFNDYVVQWWARISMLIFFANVKVENAEVLPPADEPIMFCPNHCSFLDIFCLSGYMPRRFKYISKIEILRIPMIGWAMGFAKHIAISRMDRASQMKTLKDAVETLKDGNSLVTFPEGTRSKDGRLNEFKKGPFTMASRAGVRIVPLTIIGTHIFQPPGAFVPISFPRGVRIVCHPPIDSPAPKKEDIAMAKCRESIISALPDSMQPLPASA